MQSSNSPSHKQDNEPEYIVIELDEELLQQLDKKITLNEGRWIQAKISGWMCRLEPANPSIAQQRHVHVAQNGHISNKNMQASWNQDRSRRDRKTFNQKVGSQRAAQDIARKALGLSPDVMLEDMNNLSGELLRIVESAKSGIDVGMPPGAVYLRARIGE